MSRGLWLCFLFAEGRDELIYLSIWFLKGGERDGRDDGNGCKGEGMGKERGRERKRNEEGGTNQFVSKPSRLMYR